MADKVLVTGTAGFIGFHTALTLLAAGRQVVGIDNLNSYYSPQLKRDRLEILQARGLDFRPLDLTDRAGLHALLRQEQFPLVIHLAAQAGVRYSLENPYAYLDSNLSGFLNILEGCRETKVGHLVYASSSSVYGANRQMPFSTRQGTDHPLSLYGATKKANELMAHSYAATFQLPVTGLRFFTVYGPWGRPDMALYKFARAIRQGDPLPLYNHGKLSRDFTYVDDVVAGILGLAEKPPAADPQWDGHHPHPASSFCPYHVYNLGAHQPVELHYFVQLIEEALGQKAQIDYQPLHLGDVPATFADVDDAREAVGFEPNVSIEEGLRRSLEWYREYQPRNPDM